MKSIGLSKLAALLMITFAITFLNFENLSLATNWKPYALLLLGLAILVYSFTVSKPKTNR